MTATGDNYHTLLTYLNDSLAARGYPGPLFMGNGDMPMGNNDKALVVNCLYSVFVDMQEFHSEKREVLTITAAARQRVLHSCCLVGPCRWGRSAPSSTRKTKRSRQALPFRACRAHGNTFILKIIYTVSAKRRSVLTS